MKVGLVADIHANLPALNAVLNDMPSIDVWLCAGDIVGYYADANEVCEVLRRIGAWAVRGNHDAYVTRQLLPDPERRDAYRTDWTRQHLDMAHRSWLMSLPVETVFEWENTSIRVRHATPWDHETYLYRDSSDLEKISLAPHEVLVVGHTHYPMLVKRGDGVVVNPGSVGQPRDRNPMASYAILDTQTKDVEFRRVKYDVTGLQRRLAKLGWDATMISLLSRTRSIASGKEDKEEMDAACADGII